MSEAEPNYRVVNPGGAGLEQEEVEWIPASMYNPYEIESFNLLVYGQTATGKTSFALGSDRFKYFLELDVGSMSRAAAGLDLNPAMIDYHKYTLPPTSLRDRGRVSMYMAGKDGKGAATIVHTLKGWGNLAYKFTNDFANFCEANPGVEEDIIVDTANLTWEMFQDATREDIQATAPRDSWEKELKRLEFEEPNKKVWDMCNYAKSNGKNLIFTARESEVWSGNGYVEGSHKPEGSRDLPGYVDAMIRTTVVNKRIMAELVKTAAGGKEIEGMKIFNPTLDDVLKLLRNASVIKRYQKRCAREGSMVMDSANFPAPLTLEGVAAAAELAKSLMS